MEIVRSENLRLCKVGEIIEKGDYVKNLNSLKLTPVEISVGQKVRPENYGYVLTSRPKPYMESTYLEEIRHV